MSTWMIGTNGYVEQEICVGLQPNNPGCSCDGCVSACKNTDFGGPPFYNLFNKTAAIETTHAILTIVL